MPIDKARKKKIYPFVRKKDSNRLKTIYSYYRQHPIFAATGSAGGNTPALLSANYLQGDTLGGGQSIVLTGSKFTGATSVLFGATSASFSVTSDSSITVTLPAHSAGVVNLTVSNASGQSSPLSFEYWDPTQDSNTTLLFDALASPYTNATGAWLPRFSIIAGFSLLVGTFGSNPSALGGAPVWDGDGAGEGALAGGRDGVDGSGQFRDFLGSATGASLSERPGSIGGVFRSSNLNSLTTSAPYGNPTAFGQMMQGTTGIGAGLFGTPIGSPSLYGHTYSTSGGGTTSIDVSVDGGLDPAGGKYATISPLVANSYNTPVVSTTYNTLHALVSRFDETSDQYTPYRISLGVSFPLTNSPTSQTFAGTVLSFFIQKAKCSDTFVTKHYKWAKQRFGVG